MSGPLAADARTAWRLLRRQKGRVWLFIFCVAVGAAARVGVGSFMARLDEAVRRDARVLLAADLEISGDEPLAPSRMEDLKTLLPGPVSLTRRISLLTCCCRVASTHITSCRASRTGTTCAQRRSPSTRCTAAWRDSVA